MPRRQPFLDSSGRLRVRRLGAPRSISGDLYHWLIGMPWVWFVPLMGTLFVVLNALFALLYWAHGDAVNGARSGSWEDCFFFSVQTLATIGYGAMTPKGWVGNLMVCLEAYVGLMSFAMISGLAFARFSVPHSRVIFSKNLVVNLRDGHPTLSFRMANARGNQIMQAQVFVTLGMDTRTLEGESLRRLQKLTLLNSESPVFALSFLVAHRIDSSSPLRELTPADLSERNVELIVTFVGIDDTIGQTVHGRHVYRWDEILWNHRFADTLTIDEQGCATLDLRRFHEIRPEATDV
jgi:inward rectifier potassium channel